MNARSAVPGTWFSWVEWTRSTKAAELGLPNVPTLEDRERFVALVREVLDPLRVFVGRPIRITSGYRSPEVNAAIDGSIHSQHMLGEAVDIKVAGWSSDRLARAILDAGVPFDQLIWYAASRGGHVHLSYTDRRALRREVLHAPASGGYLPRSPRSAP